MSMSTKRTARIAGWMYFLSSLPAPFALLYLPGRLYVAGDPAATAHNIAANEGLVRLAIADELFCGAAFVFVAFALHRLLEGVDRRHAALMVTLAVASVPISFLNVVHEVAALYLAKGGDFLSALDRHQLDALATLFFRLHGFGTNVAAVFWGLWLLPFGLLVYRSGFLPRVLGVLLLINGFAYPIVSFTTVLAPQYRNAVWQMAFPFLFGEMAIMLWLVIRGARDQPLPESAAA